MTNFLELLEERRTVLLKRTEHLTTNQYNLVPPGFNNNIIWNMAHALIVSESQLYSNAPFEIPIHEFDIQGFQRGTKPELAIDDYSIGQIRQSMAETVSVFRKRLNDTTATSSQMSQSVALHTLVDERTLRFILFHEDLHAATVQRLLLYV
jgi:hypothetical protein